MNSTPCAMKYDAGAGAYDRLTGRWSRLFAQAALDAAGTAGAPRVLDVATGTGDASAIACASDCAPAAVVGTDISVPMLQIAREKVADERAHFAAASAMRMPFRDASFDAAVCLFGLMYFPDRVAALAEVRRVLRPDARLALTVWGPAGRVPYAGLMGEALAAAHPASAHDSLLPFALSDPGEVERIMTAAGLAGVTLTRLTRTARFDSAFDYFDPYEQGAGRLGQIYLQLDDATRTKVRRMVLAQLEEFRTGTGFTMDLEAWLACGRA